MSVILRRSDGVFKPVRATKDLVLGNGRMLNSENEILNFERSERPSLRMTYSL